MFTIVVETLTTNTRRTARAGLTNGRDAWFTFYTTNALLRTALRPGQGPGGGRRPLVTAHRARADAGPGALGELRDGLPGIAKNLLADRLRDLEAAGVLTHEDDRYLLTDDGRALADIVVRAAALGRAPACRPRRTQDDEFRAAVAAARGRGPSRRRPGDAGRKSSPSCAPRAPSSAARPGTCWAGWPAMALSVVICCLGFFFFFFFFFFGLTSKASVSQEHPR